MHESSELNLYSFVKKKEKKTCELKVFGLSKSKMLD